MTTNGANRGGQLASRGHNVTVAIATACIHADLSFFPRVCVNGDILPPARPRNAARPPTYPMRSFDTQEVGIAVLLVHAKSDGRCPTAIRRFAPFVDRAPPHATYARAPPSSLGHRTDPTGVSGVVFGVFPTGQWL